MVEKDAEEFRRVVRAAVAAAGRHVDPDLNIARRLLNWLRTAEVEAPPADAGPGKEGATEGEGVTVPSSTALQSEGTSAQ